MVVAYTNVAICVDQKGAMVSMYADVGELKYVPQKASRLQH